MTDQIADARPPTRLRGLGRALNDMERAHALERQAFQAEVAPLREERDKWKKEAADLYHRNEILATDVHYGALEAVALRARVAQLEQERDEALGIARGLQDVIAGRVKTLKHVQAPNHKRERHHRCMRIFADLADRLAAVPSAVSPTVEQSGVELIAAERQRQIATEGWTPEHDDTHEEGELIAAAICYAAEAAPVDLEIRPQWPWPAPGKPSDPVRNLVKAGALIAAEIDRLQRAALLTAVSPGEK